MKTATAQVGRVSKSISVITDSPGAENLRLRFTADVRMPIVAKPVFRFTLNTIEGQPATQRLLLSRTDGQPLTIRMTAVSAPGLSVTAQSVDEVAAHDDSGGDHKQTPWGAAEPAKLLEPAAGDAWVELLADASLEAGRYSGEVKLATDDPEAPEIAIPYTIRVRPLIEARPDVVRMWTALREGDPGRSTIVSLSHSGNQKFSVTSVEVSHPKIFNAVAYNPEPSSQHSIRAGVVEGIGADALQGGVEGWIRVATDDPEMPELKITVLIAPNRELSRRPVRGGS